MNTPRKPIFSEVVGLVLYASIVMVVVTLIVFFIHGIADGISGSREPSPLTSGFGRAGILSPFVWVPGLILGLFVNLIRLNHKACWVWLVGISWLAFGIGNFLLHFDARRYQGCSTMEGVVNAFVALNVGKCGGIIEAGSFFTVPAICAVSYAVGARLAMLLRHRKLRLPSGGLLRLLL